MSLHWYTCIFISTYCYAIYYILLETIWWALSNASLIVWICPVIHECCSNHLSLKDKWSHNEQSSPMGYQVMSGDYKRTWQGVLTALILYIYYRLLVHATTICLPHVHPPCFYLMSYYSSTYVFLKATMLPTCALTSYL